MSSGQQYRWRLSKARQVWYRGEQVENVAEHPAFKGTVDTFASLLDLQEDPATREILTFPFENGEHRANVAFLVPRSREDIARRREAFQLWSDRTFGVMSRLSEYSRSLLTGWYASRHRWGGADGHFAEKIARYYRLSAERDLLSTVAGHDPQIDRSKRADQLDDPDVNVRIVRETEDGVIVRGAKMVATAAPYVDEIIVMPHNRRALEEKSYATMFAVAVSTPGVHLLCREAFTSTQAEDHPLSAHFDEMDAIVVFDDALIPWERVWIKEDPEAVWQLRLDPVASALSQHQTVIRLISKLEFVAAVGHALAHTIGAATYLHVQEKLGELLIQLETIKGLLVAAEEQAEADPNGIWLPQVRYLETARNLGTRFYPRALEILQQIGAGGFLQVPAEIGELQGPVGPFFQKYYRGADSDAYSRIRLFKLAWDLIGSPLAARHELYERFYSGDPVRTFAAQYVNYDKDSLIQPIWEFIENAQKGVV